MLKWLNRRNQKRRIRLWDQVLSDFQTSEQTTVSDYDAVALTYPLVVLGMSEELGLPIDAIYAPREMSICRRMHVIQLLDKEAKRIAAIDETNGSRMPMLHCHDLLYVMHRACFHHADQPDIEPETSRAIADRSIEISCRLFELGNQQIQQLKTADPHDHQLYQARPPDA